MAHTYQVSEKLEGIVSLLKDTESAQRGFILTRQNRYLEAYIAAQADIPKRIRTSVRFDRVDNDKQTPRTRTPWTPDQGQYEEIEETIDLRKKDPTKEAEDFQNAKGLEAAIKVILTDKGKNNMDKSATSSTKWRTRKKAAGKTRQDRGNWRSHRQVDHRHRLCRGLRCRVWIWLLSSPAASPCRCKRSWKDRGKSPTAT